MFSLTFKYIIAATSNLGELRGGQTQILATRIRTTLSMLTANDIQIELTIAAE
jgi:hypothetical protein